MNIELLLQAARYVEKHSDHDYCINEERNVSSGDRAPQKSKLRFYHNELERKRRADLRENLDILRQMVPADEKEKRLSTVRLLNKASSYIHLLKKKTKIIDIESQKLQTELDCLQEEICMFTTGDTKINRWLEEQGVTTLEK